MIRSHVVVDGSNIATEGRTTPSLRQLDDAVKAFLAEHPVETLTVVVDATFPNRIAGSERDEYEEALLAGELVTPPAGAIGRGDAFILQIAGKVGATVLSNDSFQELHAVHPWLFDEGRLIGGKPVHGVGWVFLLRTPVRGPVSRRATRETKGRGRSRATAPAEASNDTKEGSGRRRRGKSGADGGGGSDERVGAKANGGGRRRSASGSDNDEARSESNARTPRKPAEPLNEPLPFIEFVGKHPVGSTLEAEIETFSSHGAYVLAGGARCYVPLKLMGDPAPRAARDVMTIGETRRFAVHSLDTPRRGIDLALVADKVVGRATDQADRQSKTRDSSESQGSETVDVVVGRDPMSGSGREDRQQSSAEDSDVGTTSPPDERAQEATVTPAAKKAAAKKAPAKKAPAKKSAAKKAPAKSSATKKTAAKRAPAKKAPAKKTAAKKAPAKKTAAKKAPSKSAVVTKTPARKAPSKKAAATKTPTRSAPAKKAPPKKTAAKKAPAKKAAAKKASPRR